MYAVIKTGGKQYRVVVGQTLKVESLPVEEGQSVDFTEVLLIANGEIVTVGQPLVSGASVTASVVEHGRGEKIRILKFRRRKHSRKHIGHRQNYTAIKIESIQQ
ncbi:MAG: 50S ribosomal protein L21 [Gammaproteobacteria bacterium]|nr:50S ribosomal protein L21 [Gammaproteobacteria bacterium]MCD8524552.1 50S ribosomal protein L21 [Gammaproteobacteria bacterium]MCD8542498.1 50S ribosomal protein L21 [Gammaproteobacteria bacterium]